MKRDTSHIDLGLAIASAVLPSGYRPTLEELAAFCQCGHSAIRQIEQRALKKLRRRMKVLR